MTSELEKQFFNTFGIEPREFKSCDVGAFCPYPKKECGTDNCPYYRTYKVDYPAITDRILLELICILSESPISISFDTLMLGASDVEKLKDYILLACMGFAKDIKHQTRTLFEDV